MLAPIPTGATHKSNTYDIVSFWKTDVYAYGVESGLPFYSWFSWDAVTQKWQKESYINSSRFEKLN